MTIKGMIFLSALFMLGVGILVISQSVGSAIESRAYVQRREDLQRQRQQQIEWEENQEEREATQAQRINLKIWVINTCKWLLPILIVLIVTQTLYGYYGYMKIKLEEADFKAHQIHMDPVTRTYPKFLFNGDNGQLRIHDGNTGETKSLMEDHEPIPLLVSHATAVQLQSMIENSDGRMIDLRELVSTTKLLRG